jgi:hypothetical protein
MGHFVTKIGKKGGSNNLCQQRIVSRTEAVSPYGRKVPCPCLGYNAFLIIPSSNIFFV